MLQLQNKIEFEQNCFVSLLDASNWNSSEEARIKAVTDIASITTGRLGYPDDYNRIKLYNRLLTESAGKPSTPFEFIPIYWHQNCYFDVLEDFYKYAIFTKSEELHSNLRNLLINGGDRYKTIADKYIVIDTREKEITANMFKVIVGEVPMKVITHLVRHRTFSFVVESSRNKKYLNNVQFWYPSWWSVSKATHYKYKDKEKIKELSAEVNDHYSTPEEATMELSDRRLVKFAMAAWSIDKDYAWGTESAWDNLFAVRGNGTGTMSITGIAVETIKKLIYA